MQDTFVRIVSKKVVVQQVGNGKDGKLIGSMQQKNLTLVDLLGNCLY